MKIEELVLSYKNFKKNYKKRYSSLFKKLANEGQSPKTLFITCSDSRVVPNLITNTDPGDLFIARNIGNFVPPFNQDNEAAATASAIEYAVGILKVENIILCGHTDCGACKSLFEDIPDTVDMFHIRKWLKFGENAKNQALGLVGVQDKKKLYMATEKFNIIEQMKNILTYPIVDEKVRNNELFVHGWYYHIESGKLEYFDPVEYRFLPIEDFLLK